MKNAAARVFHNDPQGNEYIRVTADNRAVNLLCRYGVGWGRRVLIWLGWLAWSVWGLCLRRFLSYLTPTQIYTHTHTPKLHSSFFTTDLQFM